MRAFVRCEDDRVITLWMNETATVADLKQVIAGSGRTAYKVPQQRLLLGSVELDDDVALKQYLARVKTPAQGASLHLVLLARAMLRSALHYQLTPAIDTPGGTGGGGGGGGGGGMPTHTDGRGAGTRTQRMPCTVEPAPGAQAVGLDATIALRFSTKHTRLSSAGLEHSATDRTRESAMTLSVRSARDRPCVGTVAWAAGAQQQLSFTPRGCLLPNTHYTCYFLGTTCAAADTGDGVSSVSVGALDGVGDDRDGSSRLEDWAWSFKTIALDAIRLGVLERCSQQTKVLTFERTMLSLPQELIHAIANRFACDPHNVTEIKGTHRKTDTILPLVNNHTLSLLDETWSLSFTKEMQAVPPPFQEIKRGLSREEYLEEHYVNPEAGCYAIGGKMSPDEENDLLLQIISAFGGADSHEHAYDATPIGTNNSNPNLNLNLAIEQQQVAAALRLVDPLKAVQRVPASQPSAPTTTTTTTTTTTAATATTMGAAGNDFAAALSASSIGVANLACLTPWLDAPEPVYDPGGPDAPQKSRMGFAQCVKRHGYGYVRLPPGVLKSMQAMLGSMEEFFCLGADIKTRCVDTMPSFLGYSSKPEFGKEFFHVRSTARDAFWPENVCLHFREHAEETFHQLHDTAQAMLHTLFEAVGVGHGDVAQLFEDPTKMEHMQMTASNLNLFKYFPLGTAAQSEGVPRNHTPSDDRSDVGKEDSMQEPAHCPQHSDVGMLTIIPRCRGSPGLKVFDWSRSSWVSTEVGCEDDVAVVFAGETLSRATAGHYLACMHEVSGVESERQSIVFQCCARAGAVLDPSLMADGVTAGMSTQQLHPEQASWFTTRTSASRVSTNFY